MQLREQILMRERMVFAEKSNDIEGAFENKGPIGPSPSTGEKTSRRGRSGTWTGDETSFQPGPISRHKYEFTLQHLQSVREEPIVNIVDMGKKYEALHVDETPSGSAPRRLRRTCSAPAIMTQREPPEGGWRHKSKTGTDTGAVSCVHSL